MKLKPAPAFRFFDANDATRMAASSYYGASRMAHVRAAKGERVTAYDFLGIYLGQFMATLLEDPLTSDLADRWINDSSSGPDNAVSSGPEVKHLPREQNAADNQHSKGTADV